MQNTLAIASPGSALAVAVIRFYRKWITPHKGFRCAHHAVYGQGTCSGYGLEIFSERPFPEAWHLLMGRFRECGQAYNTVSEEKKEAEERRRRQNEVDSSALLSAGEVSLEGCGDLLSCSGDGIEICNSLDSCDGLGSCSSH